MAVAVASGFERFDREQFFEDLFAASVSNEYREKLEITSQTRTADELAALGNRIEALHSVPTAIASFALTPESFDDTICNVIFLGGDTDTMAAMAGAVSGAYLGVTRLPHQLLGLLESSPKGKDFIRQLARRLFDVYTC